MFWSGLIGYSQDETYQFAHLSVAEGLSQSSAIAIHQDHLGQIWIGTRDGLNKYDGTKFTVYRNEMGNPNSISNNDILSIAQDRDGFIWIGTYNGLNRYDPKTNTFKRYFHSQKQGSLSNNTVWTIEEMSNGNIGIGTSSGLSIYDKKKDAFETYIDRDLASGNYENHVFSILETRDQSVFVGTSTGLYQLKTDENENNEFEHILTSNIYHIQDLVETPAQSLLLGTREKGVLAYDFKTQIISPYFEDPSYTTSNPNVRQLVFDTNGVLWIGTYRGLQLAKNKRDVTSITSNISEPKSLSKNSVKSIFKDKKGSIWIGTYYGGVNIWDKSNVNFVNYTQSAGSNGLNYNVVSSIANFGNRIYIGTEGGGISVLDKTNKTFSHIQKKEASDLLNDNIKALFFSNNQKLWIGTFNSGIAVYDPKLNRFENDLVSEELRAIISETGVYAIKQGANENLWLGTFGKGLIKFNPKTKALRTYTFDVSSPNMLSSNLVRTVLIDSKQNVWAGTERGLNKLSADGKISTYFYEANIESGDDILSVFEDSDATIWVGTKAGGLFRLRDAAFESVVLKADAIKVSSIHSILEGPHKKLWITTNQGLINYDIASGQTVLYNQKEGIVSNEFNDNASLKVGDSQFYFGGPAGVTYFNGTQLIANAYAPQVIITDFKIKNKSVGLEDKNSVLEQAIAFTNTLNLSYDQGNFSVSFAMPNFINSNNNTYQYRLKGLEDEWIETTENTASYTIQNAGNYIFEVKGANNDGVWNTAATQINIEVAPAPWRSWWAFLIYGILILTALYFLLNILKSRTKLQQQLKFEYLEAQRAEETNKAKLEFFTNISHEFRTPLTLILGPLHQILEDYKGSSKMYKKLMVIESSSNHLLKLINRLMDFRKLENKLFKLEAAEGNIVKFLKEIYLSFSEYAKDGDYDYSFHTTEDEILVYYDRYKLERVLYNLISNAFRYTPKNGKIALRVKQTETRIIIQVEDSGVGIAPEYQDKIFERFFEVSVNNKPDNNYNKGTGIGLSIVKNIVNLHKGEIKVSTSEAGLGSIFSVELPLGRQHLEDDQILQDFKFSDDISQYVKQLDATNAVVESDELELLPSKEKATILLVEDHKPLRKFMRSLLKKDYNILEAENGKVAFKMAQSEAPDLIVSDVVMPVMVGTELCAAIKDEMRTSHIPIILLTSRTSLIYKLEGLESGADDYISKPFDINEFKLRIKNLLESTSRLKKKFTSEDPLQPNEIIVSSLDEKLYKKALEIVEAHIANELFDIPYFCSELGVSRTMLFVKIKAWTNFTPNEFIQHFRMKRAAQLLEQGKINISEVSYKVGFKNPKYFSKCFQKKFGHTPTQYANKFQDF